jgi:hypothetical protein
MRDIVGLLCASLICTGTTFAQVPGTPDPVVPASPVPMVAVESDIELSPPATNIFHAEVEFHLRWFKSVCASVPIVSIGDPLAPIPGALGQPGTQIVVGGSPPHKFEFPMTPGVQVTLGWNRNDGGIGWEFSGFIMEQAANSQHFAADANGSPNTYLPYQAPDNSFQALPFTVPGLVTGGSMAIGSTKIWGIQSDITMPFAVDRGDSTFFGKFLVGGRYLDLTDRVRVTNALHLVADPSAFAIGADQFSTHNKFGGPQVGATLGLRRGNWSLEYTTKLAAGLTHQIRNIEGSPLLSYSVLSPLLVPGPLLALPSNIGREAAHRVTLVPEISIKSRWALNSWCSLSLGYSLLYWNKVLCPGDQMSPLVNVGQVPFHSPVAGALDPKPVFAHTDYFAQGLDFGIQFRY